MIHALICVGIAISLADSRSPDLDYTSSYCGLYCVSGAAASCGIDVSIESLVSPEYLTGSYGSSADDIKRALAANGLRGILHSNMATDQLRYVNSPVILHVSGPGRRTGYRHWILFLGFHGGHVRIYDPPRDMAEISIAELLSIWDGVGIVVETANETPHFALPSLSWLSMVVLGGMVLACLNGRLPSIAIIPSAAVIVACVWHCIFPAGFVHGRAGIDNVVASHTQAVPPEINHEQLLALMTRPDAIIIDARLPSAYRSAHIPSAISVPVSCSYAGLRSKLAKIPTHMRIIVYCQNSQCGWADAVANHFIPRGYHSVYVYRGGMDDWKSRSVQPRTRTSTEPVQQP